MRYVKRSKVVLWQDEELFCKSNVGKSVYRRTCGDSTTKRNIDLQEKNIMSVYVPEMHFTVKDLNGGDFKYGYFWIRTVKIDDSVEQISDELNELLELTEIEKLCQLLADEIEKQDVA